MQFRVVSTFSTRSLLEALRTIRWYIENRYRIKSRDLDYTNDDAVLPTQYPTYLNSGHVPAIVNFDVFLFHLANT